MKKGVLISILIICFIVGGFFVIRAMNQADDVALSDDFTNRFLDTNVETDEGFHHFESGNGKFSMWFPKGYYVGNDHAQYSSKPHSEIINLFEERENEGGYKGVFQISYRDNISNERAQIRLERLLDDFSYDNQYETTESEKSIIYYGVSNYELVGRQGKKTDPSKSFSNRFFALIQAKDSDEMIALNYRLSCPESMECSYDDDREKDFFENVIENIHFNE